MVCQMTADCNLLSLVIQADKVTMPYEFSVSASHWEREGDAKTRPLAFAFYTRDCLSEVARQIQC